MDVSFRARSVRFSIGAQASSTAMIVVDEASKCSQSWHVLLAKPVGANRDGRREHPDCLSREQASVTCLDRVKFTSLHFSIHIQSRYIDNATIATQMLSDLYLESTATMSRPHQKSYRSVMRNDQSDST
ncbi:hypothetical protein MRB53_041350 [Persea americana]|nr:hypothetical protein MRB53_041350 [Persea americana]